MSKLSAAFGESYEKAVDQIRTRSFTLAGHEFKVRIPLTAEMMALQERINKVDESKAQEKFDSMTAELKINPPDGVEIVGDDVFVNGKSTKELVNAVLTMENRIVEYIRLLVPVNGSLEDISYEEIEAEWPLPVQMEMVEKIGDAIQPGYKESRKNS